MFRHGLIYLLAKLAPVLASFVLLAAYTRWLSQADYGLFSMLQVLASSASLVLLGWLYVGIMRFWEQQAVSTAVVRQLVTAVVAGVSLLGALVAVLLGVLGGEWQAALAAWVLFVGAAWYEAYQRINAITLQVRHYLWVEVGRTAVVLGSGLLLVGLGYGWAGAALAVALGFGMVLLASGALWRQFAWNWQGLDTGLLRQLWHYGVPLSLSFVLLELIHAADRVMLGWLHSYAAAGDYAVAYNLPYQALMLFGSALNLAAYPLVIRAWGQEGAARAVRLLQEYGVGLLGVGIPAAVGLYAVADALVPLLVGQPFVPAVLALLPWLIVAMLLNCFYLFYVSLSFQLARQTGTAAKVVAGAAALNVALNLLLIPAYGALGAAMAAVLAYAWCVGYGFWLGNRLVPLVLPYRDLGKIALAALVMYAAVRWLPLPAVPAALALALQVLVGVAVYAAMAWALDVAGMRHRLVSYWGKGKGWQASSMSSPP